MMREIGLEFFVFLKIAKIVLWVLELLRPISCIEILDFVVLIKNKQASIDIVYYHRLVTSYRWVRFLRCDWLGPRQFK